MTRYEFPLVVGGVLVLAPQTDPLSVGEQGLGSCVAYRSGTLRC
jgi:hypothetical protein